MRKFNFQDILLEYETLPSTNSFAVEILQISPKSECFIIKANAQTEGKGRFERKWISENNGNIYMTLAVKDYLIPLNILPILPLYISFILLKKLENYNIRYKWPNDLLIKGEKFCGILIHKFKGFFIIGIGVNINSGPEGSTFLSKHGISISAEEIFESFKKNLSSEKTDILEYLKEKFFQKEEVSINKGQFKGTFYNITKNGELILKLANGFLQNISFGDVGA